MPRVVAATARVEAAKRCLRDDENMDVSGFRAALTYARRAEV